MLGAHAASPGKQLPTDGIHRVLVVRVASALGNALLLTPLLDELHAVYPGAELDILTCSAVAEDLYGRHPNVGRILRLPARGSRHLLRYLGELRRMRAIRYDLVVDADPWSQTGRLLTGLAPARHKLGFVSRRKASGVTHGVAIPDDVEHRGQLPVHLLRAALGRDRGGDFPRPDIRLSAAERAAGRDVLQRLLGSGPDRHGHRIAGVFANGTGDKELPPEWWDAFMAELDRRLKGWQVVEILPASGRSLLRSRYPTYYSTDIRRLAGVLAALDQLISLDGGVMHLASASGTPTRAIFTTTSPAQWGPYGPRDLAVEASGLDPAAAARRLLSLAEEADAGEFRGQYTELH